MPRSFRKTFRRAAYLPSGFELVAAVAGFAAVGYWLGGKYGDAQVGTAIGAVLGIVGGMYNLIRRSLAGSRRAEASRKKSEK